jgi:hypothetical protein
VAAGPLGWTRAARSVTLACPEPASTGSGTGTMVVGLLAEVWEMRACPRVGRGTSAYGAPIQILITIGGVGGGVATLVQACSWQRPTHSAQGHRPGFLAQIGLYSNPNYRKGANASPQPQ